MREPRPRRVRELLRVNLECVPRVGGMAVLPPFCGRVAALGVQKPLCDFEKVT